MSARRLTTAEAAERFGVKPATLYAYVSRGLLSRERAPDDLVEPHDITVSDYLVLALMRRGRSSPVQSNAAPNTISQSGVESTEP